MDEHSISVSAELPEQAIAIIGMGVHAPGATDAEQLWRKLRDDLCLLEDLSNDDLRRARVPQRMLDHPRYVRRAGRIEGLANFDPELFGFTPREAALMDPQLRHLCECAWKALDDAAIDPSRPAGPIGLFVGVGIGEYLLHNLLPNHELVEEVGFDALLRLGNDRDFVASRLAYALDLRGPCQGVQAACASGSLSVHAACQSLLGRECRVALAAASSLRVPHDAGYLFEEGGLESPDGVCRTFDRASAGTLPSSAVAVLALARLEDAVAAGHEIYAVIRATAVNNDGRRKVGYAAPSVDGPSQCIEEALAVAGVEPRSIGYVEAHGTGTPFGDSIEVSALTHAFRTQTEDVAFCVLGANKPNLGHADAASGILSLIKTSFALSTRTLPPLHNFEAPHPLLNLESSPFRVITRAETWPEGDEPRRALVNCLAVGGTNVHIVLEEPPIFTRAPEGALRPQAYLPQGAELLVLSARSSEALVASCRSLAQHLRAHPEQPLADVAHTLRVGRRELAVRAAFVVRTRDEAMLALEAFPAHQGEPGHSATLEAQAQAFRAGKSLNASDFGAEGRRLVHLPSYPFEHRAFWIEPPQPVLAGQPHTEASKAAPSALSRSVFTTRPVTPRALEPKQKWLVFVDETGLGSLALARLKNAGCAVTSVRFGNGPALARDGEDGYRVDCDRGFEGFQELLVDLAARDRLPDVLLYLWTVTSLERFRSDTNRFHHNLERGYLGLIGIAQGLAGLDKKPALRIAAVTNGSLGVDQNEGVDLPEKALSFGPLLTMPLEDAQISSIAFDVDLPLSFRRSLWSSARLTRLYDDILDVVLAEALGTRQGVHAVRDKQLFERSLQTVSERLPVDGHKTPSGRASGRHASLLARPRARFGLREGGTYLIVGGFGGLGRALAEELAQRVKPRLVLLGRTPIPDRDYFADWLDAHEVTDPVSSRIRLIQALEGAGAEVLALSADVCHLESMRSAFTQISRRFGQLHGVFHAAGQLDEQLLATRTLQTARDGLATEVFGLRVLSEVIPADLDFLVSFGHASRFSPRAGLSARIAAAEFAEANARHGGAGNQMFDLPLLSDLGMYAELARTIEYDGAAADRSARALAAQIRKGSSARTVASTICDQLGTGFTQSVVGPVPEPLRVEVKLQSRADVRREYVEPETDLECSIARIWADCLGLDRVGATDNFFDLGGHSLVAVRVSAKIKAAYEIPVPLAVLIQAPTLRAFSKLIAAERLRSEGPADGRAAGSRLYEWSSVVPMQPKGSRPPLFCVGGKGGNVMNLRHLAMSLGEDQPVYGLQARGVDGIMAPHESLEAMVDEYVTDIRKVAPRGPYLLAGFSGGGALIVSMALQLQRAGAVVGPLFFLDAWNPAAPPLGALERAGEHVSLLRELGPRYLSIWIERKVKPRSKEWLELHAPALAARLWEVPPDGGLVARTWEEIAGNAAPPSYEGGAVLFRTRADRAAGEFEFSRDEQNGWGSVVKGPIQVIEVPGAHTSLLEEPHVRTLAQRVRSALDRFLREAESRALAGAARESNLLEAE